MLLAVLTTVVALSAVPPPPDGRVNKDMWYRVAPLTTKLSSADLKEREQATQALLALGPPAVEGLLLTARQSPETRDRIGDLLPKFGPSAIRQLAATANLYESGPSFSLRETAQAAVVAMGGGAHPTLEEMFALGDARFVLGALSVMHRDLSLPVLLRLPKHPNPDLRKWLVSIVGRIDRPEAADALLAATGDSDRGVRSKAWEGLGRMKDRRAIPLFREQMRSNARETILVAPGNIYAPDLLFQFASAARNPRSLRSEARKADEEDRVRGRAVLTLFRAGDAVSRGVGAR